MGENSRLSDGGWGCLFVLVIIAISYLPSWCFYVGIFWVVCWLIARAKETGDVPYLSDEIDRFLTEDRKRRRKRRR